MKTQEFNDMVIWEPEISVNLKQAFKMIISQSFPKALRPLEAL